MYKLFIDDIRNPQDVKWVQLPVGPWVVVRNYQQFVDHISKNGLPDFVTFDHDLSEEHYLPEVDPSTYEFKSGYDCAKWLIEYCIDNNRDFPEYDVHSMNPVGKMNIKALVESFKSTIK